MNQSNKAEDQKKPQPSSEKNQEAKPAPTPPRDFSMGRTVIGDSAESITRRNKQ